ncbi:DEAD/DEAH box helicase family protein [Alkalicoccobacillus gibsonii]|uniref:shikimate kinase n=1 Tax=Alkalicoccobacillus gibsonii TaxID=79881 RepID=UPI001931A8A4|nr:shikimate kinase [Alkalicoccobacillus gibsonii]MBM0064463.1 shikimate kinase [Alkalicoccobacillus gibsonii]
MKVIFLFGPQAVGKMTIGEVLSKELELPLLFNHMTLDVIAPFLGWTKKTFELSNQLRKDIFREVVAQKDNNGLIFTFVWALDHKEDCEEVERFKRIFTDSGIDVLFVELETTLKERLRRNQSENRLAKKPSKRNVKQSEEELLTSNQKHRLNSLPGEIKEPYYYRLNVTNISAGEAARKIISENQLYLKIGCSE